MSGENNMGHEQKAELFEVEQQAAEETLEVGTQSRIENSEGGTEAIQAAMAKPPDTVTCIDERAAPGAKEKGAHACVGCAGCGILIPGAKEFFETGTVSTKELQDYFNYLKNHGVRHVIWHFECGAAAKFAAEALGRTDGDKVAEEWAKKVAAHIGADTKGANVTPEGMHNARAIYYDATKDGRFDATVSDIFLTGFHISEAVMGQAQAQREAGVAVSIAFNNDHHGGFGDLFTAKNPLFIIVVAHTQAEASDRVRALNAIATANGGRVVIDTLVVGPHVA